MFRPGFFALPLAMALFATAPVGSQDVIDLPSSKQLLPPLPGLPQDLNSFAASVALSPDHRYLAVLNDGFGSKESDFKESIAVLDLATNTLTDFPDSRMGQHEKALQTFFQGLAFSTDGSRLYVSVGSLTDPEGKHGGTGNGIAVYRFADGKIQPESFLALHQQELAPGKKSVALENPPPAKPGEEPPSRMAIPYPAGVVVLPSKTGDRLLVAANLSDEALLLDAADGRVLARFNFQHQRVVPATYPYAAIATRDGKTGYVSLWNDSRVAELNLADGRIRRLISLDRPSDPTQPGSHPTALLFSPDEKWLYVTLANRDQIAVINVASGRVLGFFPVQLSGQQFDGTYPQALAQSEDGSRLFVAAAGLDAVAVFDATQLAQRKLLILGFIPTGWYPSALAVAGNALFIATGKGVGTGPNNMPAPPNWPGRSHQYTYIPALLHGSLARIPLSELNAHLANWTEEVLTSNRMRGALAPVPFPGGKNPIRHVIYVIKENRSYDQVFGDLGAGNGDPSLTMYGEAITPNQHKLARQFGILDNFYASGEVSGDGHVWSTAAITSDYMERTWQISYRGRERSYDYEGKVGGGYPLREKISNVDEPGTGYLWGNLARHGLSYRHYGEFISSEWCDVHPQAQSPQQGTPLAEGRQCPRSVIQKGEPLPAYLGNPHGSPSPWPWPVPMLADNIPTMRELVGHFDSRYPDFNLSFPDQLRLDEFLNDFGRFVAERGKTHRDVMPQFILLRLPDDHTAGTRPGMPTPSASVADNDLAVGRLVEAVSHSPYWDDTTIFIVEDDAQDGPDHVDAHRTVALVISKYSPLAANDSAGSTAGEHPFVDHNFYTTVNMIHTMEAVLGLSPMNNNDARAALIAPLFSGPGNQPAFTADTRNLTSGLIYQMNTSHSPGARESARMDFSRADAADAQILNRILWRDRMGRRAYPAIRHRLF